MNGKLLNVKYDNKEVEEMRRKLIHLEADKDKLDSELVKAKVNLFRLLLFIILDGVGFS